MFSETTGLQTKNYRLWELYRTKNSIYSGNKVKEIKIWEEKPTE